MKYFYLFLLSQTILFNCITFGKMITVVSSNEGSGIFTYKISAGSAPYFFGGSNNLLKIVIPSAHVSETFDPPGWTSTIDAGSKVTWSFTNSAIEYIDATEFEFSLKSFSLKQTNYTDLAKGFVRGEIFSNDYSPFSITSNPLLSSANIIGTESFKFIGPNPVIPEPSLFLIFNFLFLIYFTKRNQK